MEIQDNYNKKLRELHNEVKEHPFWITLSNDFHVDCIDKLKELLTKFIRGFDKNSFERCPQAIILNSCLHDIFTCMLKAKLMPKYNHMTVMEMNGFGNYILVLQTALQLVHYYLDGIFDEDTMVAYSPSFTFDSEKEQYVDCALSSTYGARDNGDGTFRLVQIIKKNEVEKLAAFNKDAAVEHAKMAKYFGEHGQRGYAEGNLKKAQYYEDKYKDLIDNKEKFYIIKGKNMSSTAFVAMD